MPALLAGTLSPLLASGSPPPPSDSARMPQAREPCVIGEEPVPMVMVPLLVTVTSPLTPPFPPGRLTPAARLASPPVPPADWA